ncbi:MAG: nucleotide sugar dehydrogenase [Elusimicrobia bacterium]|nr:nucleotide sugar dehydrogenase [Elusimicrobiota bacterium]
MTAPSQKICVIGLGYIGLPTASVLATNGFKVCGVDKRREITEALKSGRPLIDEPGLGTVVQAALKSGNLTVSRATEPADVFILCLPTPLEKNSKKADLSSVEEAAKSIVPCLKKGNLVILESTVAPGTTKGILLPILRASKLPIPGDVMVAHCPERVLPGNILQELVANDRLIGGIDEKSALAARNIYARFVRGDIYLTDCTTAEVVKLTENTYRDVNIAFANEMETICRRVGVNIWDVIRLANKHPRVNILRPGPGVGGHCIAVDPWFLVQAAPEEARMIKLAREINDRKPQRVIGDIESALAKIKKPKPVLLCLGATYKANVDDIRESPSIKIIEHFMKNRDLEILVVEPHGRHLNGRMPLVNLETGLKKADLIAVLVDHKEFQTVDWAAMAKHKGTGRLLDFKGLGG